MCAIETETAGDPDPAALAEHCKDQCCCCCCNNVLDSNLTFLISVAGNHTAYNEQDDGYEQSDEKSDDEMNEDFDKEPREGHHYAMVFFVGACCGDPCFSSYYDLDRCSSHMSRLDHVCY